MSITPFSLLGVLLANGPGVLLLSALAASIVLVWDWRWSLASMTILLLSVSSMLAALHSPTPLVSSSQWLAILVSALLLGLAGHFHRASAASHTNSNWLLRLIALLFVLGGWWVIDPGVSLPRFTQVETDLLIWIALCGVLLLGLSAAPLHTGIGLLLMTAPLQTIAPVLLPGSGLAIIIGIAQILLALACAFLTLAQPMPEHPQRTALPLPLSIQPTTSSQPSRRQRLFPRPAARQPALTGAEAVTSGETRREPPLPAEKTA